jgi:hypothetical protein
MKFLRLIILLFSISVILNSCTSFSEAGKALRNEKMKSTDEFLIKKKEPLIEPPDFDKIPEPGSLQKEKKSEQNTIEKILKTSQSKSKSDQIKSSSTEESILSKIKK